MEVVLGVWLDACHTPATKVRFADLAVRFASRLGSTGVNSLLDVTADDCVAFLWALTRRKVAPATSTVHLRRTVLHGVIGTLRQLEPNFVDPSLTLTLSPR
jgi:hypothetical protein